MIRFLIFLAFLALTEGTAPGCNVVVVRNSNYEKQVLKENVHNPYQLAVDYETNTLFFSYSTEVAGKTVFKSAYLNLETNDFTDIAGPKGGFANAYDRKTHTVYLGGEDGLYTFDYTTKTAKNIGATNMKIWQMFYCPVHGLFFTTYKPDEKAYVYADGLVKPVVEMNDTKTRLIAVGEHHDFFYANSLGMFMYKTHDRAVIKMGDYVVNGFASDVSGKLYFSSPNGVYFVNEPQKKMEKLFAAPSDEDTIYGVALDGHGNIIYALEDSIVKLVPTTKKC